MNDHFRIRVRSQKGIGRRKCSLDRLLYRDPGLTHCSVRQFTECSESKDFTPTRCPRWESESFTTTVQNFLSD